MDKTTGESHKRDDARPTPGEPQEQQPNSSAGPHKSVNAAGPVNAKAPAEEQKDVNLNFSAHVKLTTLLDKEIFATFSPMIQKSLLAECRQAKTDIRNYYGKAVAALKPLIGNEFLQRFPSKKRRAHFAYAPALGTEAYINACHDYYNDCKEKHEKSSSSASNNAKDEESKHQPAPKEEQKPTKVQAKTNEENKAKVEAGVQTPVKKEAESPKKEEAKIHPKEEDKKSDEPKKKNKAKKNNNKNANADVPSEGIPPSSEHSDKESRVSHDSRREEKISDKEEVKQDKSAEEYSMRRYVRHLAKDAESTSLQLKHVIEKLITERKVKPHIAPPQLHYGDTDKAFEAEQLMKAYGLPVSVTAKQSTNTHGVLASIRSQCTYTMLNSITSYTNSFFVLVNPPIQVLIAMKAMPCIVLSVRDVHNHKTDTFEQSPIHCHTGCRFECRAFPSLLRVYLESIKEGTPFEEDSKQWTPYAPGGTADYTFNIF